MYIYVFFWLVLLSVPTLVGVPVCICTHTLAFTSTMLRVHALRCCFACRAVFFALGVLSYPWC